MEKDYTLYPLNVSFNGCGITVDVDNDKWEFLIDKVKGQKVSKCETCEYFGNMRLATTEEINNGYAKEF